MSERDHRRAIRDLVENWVVWRDAGDWDRFATVWHDDGTSIDLAGERAIAQTKMTITQRAVVHDVECDVVCTGRFYDLLERRESRWGIVLRDMPGLSGPEVEALYARGARWLKGEHPLP